MNELEQLRQRVEYLEGIIFDIYKSGEYTMNKSPVLYKNLVMKEGVDIEFGTDTGTKIGTSGATGASPTTGEKLAFYGTTPILRQTGVAVSAGGVHTALINLGLIAT